MAELKKYLETEFLRVRSRQDNLQRVVNELVAHQRTAREFQVKVKEEVAAIRQTLANWQRIPESRTFPLRTKADAEQLSRKFRDKSKAEKFKQEIDFTMEHATKDNWLKLLFKDQAVKEFKTAISLRQLNFVQYVIRTHTNTSDTGFTAMVAASKARLYSAGYRLKRKQKENRPEPPEKRQVQDDESGEDDDEKEEKDDDTQEEEEESAEGEVEEHADDNNDD